MCLFCVFSNPSLQTQGSLQQTPLVGASEDSFDRVRGGRFRGDGGGGGNYRERRAGFVLGYIEK